MIVKTQFSNGTFLDENNILRYNRYESMLSDYEEQKDGQIAVEFEEEDGHRWWERFESDEAANEYISPRVGIVENKTHLEVIEEYFEQGHEQDKRDSERYESDIESTACNCHNTHSIEDHENYNEGDGYRVGHCLVVGCDCEYYSPANQPEYSNDDFPLSLEYDEMGADDFDYM